jgi:hypothetical protein
MIEEQQKMVSNTVIAYNMAVNNLDEYKIIYQDSLTALKAETKAKEDILKEHLKRLTEAVSCEKKTFDNICPNPLLSLKANVNAIKEHYKSTLSEYEDKKLFLHNKHKLAVKEFDNIASMQDQEISEATNHYYIEMNSFIIKQ